MTQTLKFISFALIVTGIVGTVCLSGISAAFLTCAPFLLFIGAACLGRQTASVVCTFCTVSIAVAFGLYSYYEAFHIHVHGEVDAVAIFAVPIAQSVIASIALLVAFGEWFVYRKRQEKPVA